MQNQNSDSGYITQLYSQIAEPHRALPYKLWVEHAPCLVLGATAWLALYSLYRILV